MDVFEFRDRLVSEYERFTRSFIRIRAADIKTHVDGEYAAGRFWPAPMVQLNPAFVAGGGRFSSARDQAGQALAMSTRGGTGRAMLTQGLRKSLSCRSY
jgi:hypothetical protein